MITFVSTLTPLVAADLDDVEGRFGFKFPKEFRDHYLQFNGGYPEKDRFVDHAGVCIIHEFLPIRYGNADLTLEHSVQQVKVNSSLLPAYLVQFAVDPGGDYYCFSTRENDYGAIYMFRMDGNPQRMGEFLSTSLNEFLGKLRSREE